MSYRPLGLGIYRIVNPNGAIYIGQTWNFYGREYSYSKGWCKQQIKLYNSIKKYGWNNHSFEIIHTLPEDIEQSVLDSYELLYYVLYKEAGSSLLNIREPNGSRGKHSEETKQKISKLRTGMKFSEEHVANMSKARMGKKQSRETVQKRVQTNRDRGKLISANCLSAATQAKKIPHLHLESGVLYDSEKEAAIGLKCSRGTIVRAVKKGTIIKFK
jgi:group I intron endonuclease